MAKENPNSCRNLQSFLIVTIHAAVIAAVVRRFFDVDDSPCLLIGFSALIGVGGLVLWLTVRSLALAWNSEAVPDTKLCPRCCRPELRPIVRPGSGLFHPAIGSRCAACWTTFCGDDDCQFREGVFKPDELDPSAGIWFLSDELSQDEIRYLIEPSSREHLADARVPSSRRQDPMAPQRRS